jgi:hypothetical protein
VAEKKKTILKMNRAIQEKEQENQSLRAEVEELESAVAERQKIFQIQSSRPLTFGKETKMKGVVKERKLREIVKSQGEEIRALEMELQKLKEKNFAMLKAPPLATLPSTSPIGTGSMPGTLRTLHSPNKRLTSASPLGSPVGSPKKSTFI